MRETITLSLHSLDDANRDEIGSNENPGKLPLVITAPFTDRFKVTGPPELQYPFMPLLTTTQEIAYQVEFVLPREDDADYAWSNYHDRLVIQSRVEQWIIDLRAIHDASTAQDPYHPPQLPEVKAPSFKLFDQIEKNALPSLDSAASRSVVKLAESFHPAKKHEIVLDPIHSSDLPTVAARPSSPVPEQHENCNTLEHHAMTELEAKAVIQKLRARRLTRKRAIQSPVAAKESLDTQKSQADLISLDQKDPHDHRCVSTAPSLGERRSCPTD